MSIAMKILIVMNVSLLTAAGALIALLVAEPASAHGRLNVTTKKVALTLYGTSCPTTSSILSGLFYVNDAKSGQVITLRRCEMTVVTGVSQR